jgi:integrase
MFAGLRISEIKKADWKDVDWERGVIHVKGKVRSMAKRPVDLEPVLVDWLKPLAQTEGDICTPERPGDIEELRKLTYHFPSNVFRHSYGSYHWGAFQNPQKTAMEMGHTNLQMLYKYYRKPLPQKIAAPFWQLDRATVLAENGDAK